MSKEAKVGSKDTHGIIFTDYLKKKTLNAENAKRTHLCDVSLRHHAVQRINKNNFLIARIAPYSTDSAPRDFFVLRC